MYNKEQWSHIFNSLKGWEKKALQTQNSTPSKNITQKMKVK